MKKKYRITKRFVSLLVVLALALTLAPAAAAAPDAPAMESAAVTVDAIPEGMDVIAVPFGTAQDAIPFPLLTSGDVSLDGVTWEAEAYDAQTPGDYVFTATLPEGYMPPDGQADISATVTVAQPQETAGETIQASSEAPAPEETAAGQTGPPPNGTPPAPETAPVVVVAFDAPNPATYEIAVGGELPALPETLQATGADGETLTIEGVTWATEGFDANTPGDYVFTAKLPKGYEAAPETGVPQVAVRVLPPSENAVLPQAISAQSTYTISGKVGKSTLSDFEGFASVPLHLYAEGEEIALKRADNVGNYSFAGLGRGTYTVTIPAGRYGAVGGKDDNYAETSVTVFIINSNQSVNIDLTGNNPQPTYSVQAGGVKYNVLSLSTDQHNGTVEVGGNRGYSANDFAIPAVITVDNNPEGLDGTYDVVGISKDAFSGGGGLTGTLTIPASVKSIGESAFWSCSGITALDLSDFTGSIGESAFKNCGNLAAITFGQSEAPTLPGSAFTGVKENGTIYCPQGATGYDKLLTGGLAKWQLEPFEPHTVTVNNATGGSATASQYTAQTGTVVTLTAKPEGNYDFTKWEVSTSVKWTGGTSETSPVAKFAMPDGDVTVTPEFTKARYDISGTVTVKGSPAGGVTVQLGTMTTTTDNNGKYKFTGLKNGNYPLSAKTTVDGVEYSDTTVIIISGADITKDLSLQRPQKRVQFSGLTANGSDDATTTALTITFDTDTAVNLEADQIGITGEGVTVEKGALTPDDDKKTWTLNLNKVRIAGSNTSALVKVKLNLSDEYALTPTEKTVTVYQAPRTVPGAPANLQAASRDGEIRLTWETPLNDGGSNITGYQYHVSPGDGDWTDIPNSSAATSYTVTGLANDTTYTFRVRAVNIAGGGVSSNEVFATPRAAYLPGAPSDLRAAPGDGQVALTWKAPASDGGSPILRYEVSTDGGNWTSTATTSYTVTGLANGFVYNIKVRAVNKAGAGAAVSISATPQVLTTPSAPRNLAITYNESSAVRIAWDAPISNGGSAITGYQVSRDGGAWINETRTSYTDYGCGDGEHIYRVRAVNEAGAGTEASIFRRGTEKGEKQPSAPKNFTAVPGDRQVTLSWSAPNDSGGSVLLRYEVSADGGKNWVSTGMTMGYIAQNLINGIEYTFLVRAVNLTMPGQAADINVTLTLAAPARPADLRATPGDGQASLTWTASEGAESYEVSVNGGGWMYTGSASACTVTGLTNGVEYSFWVRAKNAGGISDASDPATATPTADTSKPGAPTGLAATPGDGKVDLTWTAPAGGAGVTGYQVSIDDGNSWTGTGGPSTGCTVTKLANGTEYIFRVRAVNASGAAGNASEAATATPFTKGSQTAPAAPTEKEKTATSVTLNDIPGEEYRMGNDGEWQEIPTFGGLKPNTEYTFYARLKETDTLNASPASAGTQITTAMAALTGSVSISGTFAFGEELAAVTTGLTSTPSATLGALTYQWKRGDVTIAGATDASYTLTADDIGAKINVTVTAANCTGSVTSANETEVAKADAPKPAAPTVQEKTPTSVTLVAIPGAEYSIDGINWYSSTLFENLLPNTDYTFYVQMKETATHKLSPASDGATVKTEKAALSGSVAITGTHTYGETLTADTSGLTTTPVDTEKGALSYQWKRGGDVITGATGPTYTLAAADVDKVVNVTVTAANCDGNVTSTNTSKVAKAAGPSAPTVTGSYTGDGVSFTYTITAIDGAEYKTGTTDWQPSNVFTGYYFGDTATFYARMKETGTHQAGLAGNTEEVTFVRLDQAAPPLAYTIEGAFPKTVTITPVDGAEYSFNGSPYGAGNTYISNAAEDVTLGIRLKATDTHNASPAATIKINTKDQDQPAPVVKLEYAANGETDYTVTIPEIKGAEYSFDGTTFGTERSLTGCKPGETVTGYARLAAKPGYNTGSVASASVTLPLFAVHTPTISPSGGTFTAAQSVTLSCTTADADIYYTLDGNTPNAGSTRYTGTFTLTKTATVKAIAIKAGMADSATASADFTRAADDLTPIDIMKDATFTLNGDFALIGRVLLDGIEMGQINKTATSADLTWGGYTGNAGRLEKGSVIVTLYKEFLKTLPEGSHTLTVEFNDAGGAVSAGDLQFAVPNPEPTPTPNGQPTATPTTQPTAAPTATGGGSAKTGDDTNMALWIALVCVAGAAIAGIMVYRKRKYRNQ